MALAPSAIESRYARNRAISGPEIPTCLRGEILRWGRGWDGPGASRKPKVSLVHLVRSKSLKNLMHLFTVTFFPIGNHLAGRQDLPRTAAGHNLPQRSISGLTDPKTKFGRVACLPAPPGNPDHVQISLLVVVPKSLAYI